MLVLLGDFEDAGGVQAQGRGVAAVPRVRSAAWTPPARRSWRKEEFAMSLRVIDETISRAVEARRLGLSCRGRSRARGSLGWLPFV